MSELYSERVVKLVELPFSLCHTASLALTTFKAQLTQHGLQCQYFPLHLHYAAKMGFEKYADLTGILNAHPANWIFSEHISSATIHEYLQDVPVSPDSLYECRFLATRFLEKESNKEHWKNSMLVGFSTFLHQLSAALSFSKLLKKRNPSLPIVMGGASMIGDAGIEFVTKCPWIDVAFLGQSDFSFIKFCSRMGKGQSVVESLQGIPGVVFRNEKGEVIVHSGHSSVDLNKLPTPDYDEYLDVLELYKDDPFFQDLVNAPQVFIEMSRGCSYGVKKLCKFCSYVDSTNGVVKFRSPENALKSLRELHSRYFPRINVFSFADPLFPKQLIPTLDRWAEERQELGLKDDEMVFWAETKPWLTRNELSILKKAGLAIVHFGVEHLHPDALKGMNKGQTSIACIAHMKWALALGIKCEWHYMLEIPGQEDAWNEEIWELIGKLTHLPSPIISSILLTQNSPYYIDRGEYGIDARPDEAYRFTLPSNIDLKKAAYLFSYDVYHHFNKRVTKKTEQLLSKWDADFTERKPELTLIGSLVIDTRRESQKGIELTDQQIDVLIYCDLPRTVRKVAAEFGNIEEDIKFLLSHDLIIHSENRYLSLVMTPEIDVIPETIATLEYEQKENLVPLEIL